uniref:RRM domain-containing protein n=1 Tax=Ciona intestinalis TaxID=7719 RepID=F6UF46_CIOIN
LYTMSTALTETVNLDNGDIIQMPKMAPPPLTPEQKEALAKAKRYAVQESVKHVLLKQEAQAKLAVENSLVTTASQPLPGLPSGLGNENMFLQKQQALVLMCRVYVGSIYYDLKEEIIRNAFSPFGPFKSINMSFDPITGKHKGFAFIEYETPEAAQLSLDQMGGVMLGGRSIKVGRPANMPQSHPVIDLLLDESKMQKRIYISSVHTDLNTEDLKSVFSAFGNILSCALVPDVLTGKHKGYGFIEYDTLQAANDAVASMNLFDLGGQYLRVGKAIAPVGVTIPPGSSFTNSAFPGVPGLPSIVGMPGFPSTPLPTPAAIPAPGVVTAPVLSSRSNPNIPPPGIAIPTTIATTTKQKTAKETMELPNTLSAQEDMKLSGVQARHMIMQKLMRKEEASKVMVLHNMVDVEEIDDDLESEVTEECGKFGSVSRVVIYQEKQSEAEDAPVTVKIYVEFTDSVFCKKAVESLNGRWFGGRKIEAIIYPQHKFNHNDLTG